MIQTAQGIVIQTIQYSDKKLIVKLLCAKFGLRSGLVYVSKTQKSNTRHLFAPLQILDFESDFQEVNRFIPIKNPKLAIPLHNTPTDPVKTAMVLFMNEVLAKTMADDYVNDTVFHYLKNSLSLLDDAIDVRNFHLWWLLEITRHYGFYPQYNGRPDELYFDMPAGTFLPTPPAHPYYPDEVSCKYLIDLLDLEWPQVQTLELHSSIRASLLQNLILYLKLHLENLREIKSLDILHAVFH